METFVEISDPSILTHTFSGELLVGVTYKFIIAAANDVFLLNSFEKDKSFMLLYSEPL